MIEKKVGVSIIIVLFILLLVYACDSIPSKGVTGVDKRLPGDTTFLPSSATVIKHLGKGWLVIELDGFRFLYNERTGGFNVTITQLTRSF